MARLDIAPSWSARVRAVGRRRAAGLLAALGRSPADDWLRRWLPTVSAHAQGQPVLELGCGRGEDTAVLCQAGLSVWGVDLSEPWLRQARRRAPAAVLHCQDLRDEFPLKRTGVVVASLSLHYFRWEDTTALVGRIERTLQPGGLLLCRFNSTRDTHFGATGHGMIEPGLFLVDGQPKRFFDEAAIRHLFERWSILSMEERVTYRYVLPKFVWEVALVVPPASGTPP